MCTKRREPLIVEEAEETIKASMISKAHELDVYIEEFGAWNDHVHLLIRAQPTMSLSDIYGRLKGYSAWILNQNPNDRRFNWSDGVYAVTVDPDNCNGLRSYIRNQRSHHRMAQLEPKWEPSESSPPGLPEGSS